MFSRPLSSGSMPVPSSISASLRPRNRTTPRSGLSNPYRIFSSVLLPAPLRPTTASDSPRRSSNDTSSTAQNSPARNDASSAPRGRSSRAMSRTPYQSARRIEWQYFFDRPDTASTTSSLVMR